MAYTLIINYDKSIVPESTEHSRRLRFYSDFMLTEPVWKDLDFGCKGTHKFFFYLVIDQCHNQIIVRPKVFRPLRFSRATLKVNS